VTGVAPGAPGARALWTAGNKDGFGPSTTLASKDWYTLNGGELTEVYYLDAMANTANDGLMPPEQVWDDNPPAGTDGRLPGTGTGSATPLGWTHAQFIRLAWSIDAGRPVEQPNLVSCRYGGPCSSAAP